MKKWATLQRWWLPPTLIHVRRRGFRGRKRRQSHTLVNSVYNFINSRACVILCNFNYHEKMITCHRKLKSINSRLWTMLWNLHYHGEITYMCEHKFINSRLWTKLQNLNYNGEIITCHLNLHYHGDITCASKHELTNSESELLVNRY